MLINLISVAISHSLANQPPNLRYIDLIKSSEKSFGHGGGWMVKCLPHNLTNN